MDDVVKILDNIDIKILTLEIQLSQLSDDVAAKGSIAVIELLRKDLLKLEETFKNNKRSVE